MIYVVEVQDNKGRKATKEYEVTSFGELTWMLQDELAGYGGLRVSRIWRKGEQRQLVVVVS